MVSLNTFCISQSLSPCNILRLLSDQELPLLLLSRSSHVRLCASPQTIAHQAPPSLGFSRQEHWSGLPFPSPMHESESEVLSRAQLAATPWPAAFQAPPSMGFSRQACWSGLPCPPPGDLPYPGVKPTCLRSPALAGRSFTTSAPWEAPNT